MNNHACPDDWIISPDLRRRLDDLEEKRLRAVERARVVAQSTNIRTQQIMAEHRTNGGLLKRFKRMVCGGAKENT